MKENKYDDNIFFQKYSQMSRSQKGLAGAGEWETLKKMLPDFKGKRVLDLGCGYGWHCIYAMENGASSVVGVDISHKMLEVAKGKTHFPQIEYECCAIEDVDFPEESFDVILSSLAFHYVADYENLIKKIYRMLKAGGNLVLQLNILFLLLMEHKTGIITKKEKYCISRWTIIIMRANGQLCFWKKRLQNIIEH
ncbi:class I SAM-dependent methyltransferase [Enterococcus faecium]|nr:class I SAM-dependent methyltransferase [Enterococcus faecium]